MSLCSSKFMPIYLCSHERHRQTNSALMGPFTSQFLRLLDCKIPTIFGAQQGFSFVFNFTKILFGLHLIHDYVFGLYATVGPSMLPTLNARGDWVYISKHYRRGKGVHIGDVVSIKHPMFPHVGASKRILGMPGDFVLRDAPGSKSQMMIQVRSYT